MHLISSKHFDISRKDKTMVTFASDIRLGRGVDFERIYPDACDAGLRIESERTLERSTWYLVEAETDEQKFILRPTTESARKFSLNDWVMIIYNT